MRGKVQKAECSNGRNDEIRAWMEEHPEIKRRDRGRPPHMPAAKSERAFTNAAKTEAPNQALRSGPKELGRLNR
jgi:hypothetical protein